MKLRAMMMAAVATTMTVASTAASAADYLIYDFAFTGTGSHYNNQTNTGVTGLISGSIIYYLPTSFAGPASATLNIPAPFPTTHRITGSYASNVFTLTEVLTQFGRSDRRDILIRACLSEGMPGPTIAIDSSCSSVRFEDVISLGTTGGDANLLNGTLTGLTITDGFGNAQLGLVSAPILPLSAVPEPASWAMMILGMGAVGGLMRRRKITTRVTFA